MERPHAEDLTHAREIVSGSTDAWENFVHRYSGLIFSVIRRYLLKEDEDEQRNVYVRVLEDLYTRRLADYDGSSSLATWVVTVARSRSFDFLRGRYGRRAAPRWLEDCPEHERRVYTLHYIEGLGLREIARRLESEGYSCSEADVCTPWERG
jgi:DNA-directed RNA polymerase specialized sigma24 family protein